jgi:hypothetical protein
MSTENDDSVEALVAFVSGAVVGAAATLLFLRARRNRCGGSAEYDDDYGYDGGDIFI